MADGKKEVDSGAHIVASAGQSFNEILKNGSQYHH